jgi:hypothetical protein
MTELSPRARALFESARRGGAPSSQRKAALLARLEKTVGAPSTSAPVASLHVLAGFAGLAAAMLGIVSLLAAHIFVFPETRSPQPQPEARRAPPPTALPASFDSAPITAVVPADAIVVTERAPRSREETARSREETARSREETARSREETARTVARPSRHGPPAASSAVDPSNELTLLRAAQTARRERRFDDALSLLDMHAARFPRGLLAPERQVTQALVLCESGARTEGRVLAAPLRTSAWAGALATACGSPEDDQEHADP